MNKNLTYLIILSLSFFIPKTNATDTLHICFHTPEGFPVESVNANVGGSPTPIAIPNNNPGCASFDLSNTTGLVTITPSKNINPLNGVDVLDLIVYRLNVLAVELFTNPYQIIASDINDSYGISGWDAVMLHKLIIGDITEFPNHESWRFIVEGFVFTYTSYSIGGPFPESLQISTPLNNNLEVGFVGVKMGDVNGSADPQSLTGQNADTRTDALILKIKNQEVDAGDTVTVDITSPNFTQMMGYQFTFQFDTAQLDFIEVIPGQMDQMNESNFNTQKVDKGIIPHLWFNAMELDVPPSEIIFSITFTAKQNLWLKDVFELKADPTPVVAYDIDREPMDVILEFEEVPVHIEPTVKQDMISLSLSPNPFSKSTTLSYNIKDAGGVKLMITDISGKVISTVVNTWQPAGIYNINFSATENMAPGVYFSRLKINDEMVVQRFVLMQ